MGDLKKTIREEYLRGVPEFVLRQATERYVDEIRQHIKRFILMTKSESNAQQREAIKAAEDVLQQLQEDSFNLLEDKLFQFIRNV